MIVIAIPLDHRGDFHLRVRPCHASGLGWALFWLLSPASVIWALVYYGLTFGSPASATLGMRAMDIEMRTWYGAPAYFVLGAVHAVVFWISVSVLTPFILLVGFFNARRRLLHDMLVGTVVINNAARAASLRAADGPRMADLAFDAPAFSGNLGGNRADDSGDKDRRSERTVTQHSRDTPQFYLTAPSPCPYLAGNEERKVFTHLVGERAGRAQQHPHPGRIPPQPVDRLPAGLRRLPLLRFGPRRRQGVPIRRGTCGGSCKRNADIAGEMQVAVPTSEQYSIFRAYLDSRHRDGGMADMTVLDYAMMVEDSHIETRADRISRAAARARGVGRARRRPRRGRA